LKSVPSIPKRITAKKKYLSNGNKKMRFKSKEEERGLKKK
jgi:hypothetical protein